VKRESPRFVFFQAVLGLGAALHDELEPGEDGPGGFALFGEKVVRFLDVRGSHRDNEAAGGQWSLILTRKPAIKNRWTPGF
jgi:hypothetical protein